ncbi:MAG: hypothetical protein AAFO07_02035 [Bacteroidota bacterium]
MQNLILYITRFYKKDPKYLVPLSALIVVILVLFFGLPDEILYAKKGILKWIPFLMIFGLIPFLITKVLNHHNIRIDYIILGCCAAIFILGPSFGMWLGIQSDNDLKINGNISQGVVYKKWLSNKNSKDEWLVRCHFYYEGKQYSTFSEEDTDNQFQVGDSLLIKFSKKFPDNNKIIGLNEKLTTN